MPDSAGIPHVIEGEVLIAPYNDLATVEALLDRGKVIQDRNAASGPDGLDLTENPTAFEATRHVGREHATVVHARREHVVDVRDERMRE